LSMVAILSAVSPRRFAPSIRRKPIRFISTHDRPGRKNEVRSALTLNLSSAREQPAHDRRAHDSLPVARLHPIAGVTWFLDRAAVSMPAM
jgi:hypothetical protein